MPASDPDPRFVVEIGSERFDPKEQAATARRRANAGKKKLASALGVEVDKIPGADREACLVQFEDELNAETVVRMREEYGLKLDEGPNSLTFVERLDKDAANRLRRDPAVRACVVYEPQLKIAPTAYEEFAEELEVGLTEGDAADTVSNALTQLNANVVDVLDARPHGGGVSLIIRLSDKAVLVAIASLSDVAWIAPRPKAVDNNVDSASVNQGGTPATAGSHPIWDKGLHGEGMVIGVMDRDAIDMQSKFYLDSSPAVPGPTHRKVVSLQLRAAATAPSFHATAVTACAVGDEDGRAGLNANRGSAWAARLAYSDRFRFLTSPAVSTYLGDVAAAESVGARIHSYSWGTPGGASPASYDQLAASADQFTFQNEDHLMLVAPPNSADPSFQGGLVLSKNALAVNATKAHPNQDQHADGKHNLTGDGRRKPDMLGVGADVVTANLTGSGVNPLAVTSPVTGTSAATPHVAGAAALIRQYFTEGWYPTGKKEARNAFTPTGVLLKAMLLNATVDMSGPPGYPSAQEGWGRLKLYETLHFDGDKIQLRLWDVRHRVGLDRDGTSRTFILGVPANAKSMKLTLSFHDPAGAVVAADPVVNQLDLEALTPPIKIDGKNPVGPGSTGVDVTSVQLALVEIGHNPGPPDGVYGNKTRTAIEAFQNAAGLVADGIVGSKTAGAINRARRTIVRFGNDFQNKVSRVRDLATPGLTVPPDPAELKNNVRQILVENPIAGRWQLRVRAHKVDQAKTPVQPPWLRSTQGYALVARVELT